MAFAAAIATVVSWQPLWLAYHGVSSTAKAYTGIKLSSAGLVFKHFGDKAEFRDLKGMILPISVQFGRA